MKDAEILTSANSCVPLDHDWVYGQELRGTSGLPFVCWPRQKALKHDSLCPIFLSPLLLLPSLCSSTALECTSAMSAKRIGVPLAGFLPPSMLAIGSLHSLQCSPPSLLSISSRDGKDYIGKVKATETGPQENMGKSRTWIQEEGISPSRWPGRLTCWQNCGVILHWI